MPVFDDKKWRAESDARTIAEAAAIKKDPKRWKAAKTAAKGLAKQQEDQAKQAQDSAVAMRSLAKGA